MLRSSIFVFNFPPSFTINIIDRKPVWEVTEFAVEVDGVFIWPRSMRADGKYFGFDRQALARIRAEYSDRIQFYAQYYNDQMTPDQIVSTEIDLYMEIVSF